MTATVPLHRNRDFVLLWSGHWVSFLGSRMSSVCYPLLALWISGGSATIAGLATFAAIVPSVLFQLPAGALVDRWDRRTVMMVCAGLRTVALATVAVALVADVLTIPLLLGVVFADLSLAIFAGIAERVTVRAVVPTSQLGSAMSQNEARGRVAGLLGAPVGTVLFTYAKWGPYVLAAAGALVAMTNVLFIRADCSSRRGTDRSVGREMIEGFAWVKAHPFLRTAITLLSLSGLFFQLVTLGLIVILVKEQGYAEGFVGLLLGISGCGGVLGAVSARWWMGRVPFSALIIGGFAGWAVLMALTALFTAPVPLGLLFGAMNFVGAVFNVASAVYQMTATPDALQGRAAGTAGFVAAAAASLGALGAGPVLDAWGGSAGVLVAAAGMALIAGTAVAMPVIRHAQLAADEPTAPKAAAAAV